MPYDISPYSAILFKGRKLYANPIINIANDKGKTRFIRKISE